MKRALMLVMAGLAVLVVASAAAAPAPLKLKPVSGNFTPPSFKFTGNATYAQSQWTNKVAQSGKFSVLLEKSVDFASCYTATPENGCAAFAAAIVEGVEGSTVGDLGTIGFWVKGTCGAGSPRFNLEFTDLTTGNAGVAFYGCANHQGPTVAGWTQMSSASTASESYYCYDADFNIQPCTLGADDTVNQLSVLVDEKGTWYVDTVTAAANTTGEPNGS